MAVILRGLATSNEVDAYDMIYNVLLHLILNEFTIDGIIRWRKP